MLPLLNERIPGARPADIQRLRGWQLDTLKRALNNGVSIRRHKHAWLLTLPGWKEPTIIVSDEGLAMIRPSDLR